MLLYLLVALAGLAVLGVGIFFDFDLDGWMGTTTIGAFLAVSGFTAMILDPSSVVYWIGVLAAGSAAAVAASFLMRRLDSGVEDAPSLGGLSGTVAVVASTVSPDSPGVVLATLPDGLPVRLTAVTDGKTSVATGSQVLILEVLSPSRVRVTDVF